MPVHGDRIGVVASVLCAIHCAATPFLLLFLPVFGEAWSHPASHWLMALLVVPLAAITVATGFKRHRRKWVVGTCVVGIVLVLVGAAAPSLEKAAVPTLHAGMETPVSTSVTDDAPSECAGST